jgi:hypothetical protein
LAFVGGKCGQMPSENKSVSEASQPPQPPSIVPRLYDAAEVRAKLRCSESKWRMVKHEIEHVVIGSRRFWTDEAIVAYLRRQTRRRGRREEKRNHKRGT